MEFVPRLQALTCFFRGTILLILERASLSIAREILRFKARVSVSEKGSVTVLMEHLHDEC